MKKIQYLHKANKIIKAKPYKAKTFKEIELYLGSKKEVLYFKAKNGEYVCRWL